LEKEEWLYRALHGRTVVFSKDMNFHITTMTHGLDVASGINSIIGNKNSYGETFNVTNKMSYKWEEILDIYRKTFEDITGEKLRVLLSDLDTFKKIIPRIYQIDYDRMYDRKFNNLKISQYVDVEKFINIQYGLSQCLKTFLSDVKFNRIDWKSEAYKDRLTKENTPLSEINGLKQKIKYLIYRYLINN